MRTFRSSNLKRHGDSQEVVQWAFFMMAMLFWIAAKLNPDPIMPAEVYGDWVVSINAEIWAGSILMASGLYLLGVMINGSWKWSPVLRLVGALWHVITLGLFSASASHAVYGDFMTLAAGVFCGVHIWFTWLNVADLRANWGTR